MIWLRWLTKHVVLFLLAETVTAPVKSDYSEWKEYFSVFQVLVFQHNVFTKRKETLTKQKNREKKPPHNDKMIQTKLNTISRLCQRKISVGICLDIYPENIPWLEPRNPWDKTICITPRNTGQIFRNSDFSFSWHPPIFKNCNRCVKIQFVSTMHSLHSQSCQAKHHCSLSFLVDTQCIMKKFRLFINNSEYKLKIRL